MTLLAELALRSSVILAAGLLLDTVLRSRAAALRHFVLAGAIAAAALVVPLGLVAAGLGDCTAEAIGRCRHSGHAAGRPRHCRHRRAVSRRASTRPSGRRSPRRPGSGWRDSLPPPGRCSSAWRG